MTIDIALSGPSGEEEHIEVRETPEGGNEVVGQGMSLEAFMARRLGGKLPPKAEVKCPDPPKDPIPPGMAVPYCAAVMADVLFRQLQEEDEGCQTSRTSKPRL